MVVNQLVLMDLRMISFNSLVVVRTSVQRDSRGGQERGRDGRRSDHHGQLPPSRQFQVEPLTNLMTN